MQRRGGKALQGDILFGQIRIIIFHQDDKQLHTTQQGQLALLRAQKAQLVDRLSGDIAGKYQFGHSGIIILSGGFVDDGG